MLETKFTPFPEISTARLQLRRITAADAAEILELRASDAVMRYIDKEKAKTIEDALAWVKMVDDALVAEESLPWAISLKEDTTVLIGTIAYGRFIKQHYRAEVGYMLHPRYWNQRIMSEALEAVIDYGFNTIQLHSIEAHINPGNMGSSTLLEKAGFVREAYFKEDYFFHGKFMDTAIYSLLNNK
ncbi:MAG: GNAT family N-acetyltransferase [Sphingobacteriales bacterium]|nr:GNAT family N-acetyltransferase [Sphingobacteriales bacterium]